jgi:N6-adenosine-specific RNA methylase IME4
MKKYNVIYADPPWDQKAGPNLSGGYKVENGVQVFNNKNNISQPMQYHVMSVTQIMKLPVKLLCKNDAVLFMWVTNKYLPCCFDIISAWGFTYSTTLVWAKNQIGSGLGGTFKISTEFLIYARKGNLKPNIFINNTWFNVARKYKNGYPQHSAKPDFFRDLISKTFNGTKLELFARSEYPGWDVYGNEVNNSIILPSSTITE